MYEWGWVSKRTNEQEWDRVRCAMELPIISINLKLFDSIIVNADDVSRNSPNINISKLHIQFICEMKCDSFSLHQNHCINCVDGKMHTMWLCTIFNFSLGFCAKWKIGIIDILPCSWMKMSSFSISFQINPSPKK